MWGQLVVSCKFDFAAQFFPEILGLLYSFVSGIQTVKNASQTSKKSSENLVGDLL